MKKSKASRQIRVERAVVELEPHRRQRRNPPRRQPRLAGYLPAPLLLHESRRDADRPDIDANRQQLSLLDSAQSEAERERSAKLMATMDELNQKMGRGTVTLGRPSPGAAWHLRCANRTPRWTTRWSELLNVKAR